jgi:AcrR family transcriptional regulator
MLTPIVARTSDAKSKIEETAQRLFVEQGVAETSIREIAHKAGVSQGAMYNHYESKEELAWSLFSNSFSELGTDARRLVHDHTGIDARLRAMIRYIFERFDQDWIFVSYVFFARHQHLRRVTPNQGNPYTVFRLVIAEGIRHGEIPKQNLNLATSMVVGCMVQVIDGRILKIIRGPLAGYADSVATACLKLLR